MLFFNQVPDRELSQSGHRAEVKCLAFSSMTEDIISASKESIKVWQR